ncbi:gluconolaconase [Streptomyces sp. ODS28]|uniref:gluconolaconase n=1 Tax=Streptomyces sp. ODS28 TaxID=3136688 RepID=UPI0031E59A9D
MGNESAKNPVGTAYINDVFMRHPLTTKNQRELGIEDKAAGILERNRARGAFRRTPAEGGDPIDPVGFSLNKVRYERFPADEDTARQRGWRAYMNVGVPVVEERGGVEQPPPDVISKQTYVNGTDPIKITVTDTVEFSISNTISWSLQGEVKLTFGAKSTSSLQQQLQKSMAMQQYQKSTMLNSKDRQGTDAETQTQMTSTTTATGTATGTGELWGELLLGITGSISGSLTTAWKHTASVSVEVSSRVDVPATQRREVRRFDYEYPVTFGGWVALYYEKPVQVQEKKPQGPEDPKAEPSKVIAWRLGDRHEDGGAFDLADEDRRFLQKGEAEIVSVCAGEHRVFQPETLDYQTQKAPLYQG